MKPTPEQAAVIDTFRSGDHLVIEAGAGTGKTSTLRMLADATPGRRGVYIAYNRSIAQEAQRKFPARVTCKTAHSFAYGAVGKDYRARLNGPRVPAYRAAKILGLGDPLKIGDVMILAPQSLARLVAETIRRFCYSDATRLQAGHVPWIPGLDAAGQRELARFLVPVAQRAWDEEICWQGGRLRFEHDHYLKIWTLTRPQLDCEYVLLDEAQDSNGCVAGLVNAQQAQRVWVGDRAQSIYRWRGAVDAMEHAPGTRLYLSQSFRFGPAVAQEANKWLSLLGTPLRLRGHEPLRTTVGPVAEPAAILCRTNAGAITAALAQVDAGRRAALAGGGDEIRRFALAAEQLQAGQGTSHPDLMAFSHWSEVRAYVKDSGESDLRTLVQLVDAHTPRGLIRIIDSLADERHADVVVSTAHKAKGREWASVRIAGDFQEPKRDDGAPDREEIMLAYVAVTRAKHALDRGGLAWVDHYAAGRAPERAPGSAVRAADPFAVVSDETTRQLEAVEATFAPGSVEPPEPVEVPHCWRCGSHTCLCDPAAAAAASARLVAPAGPESARRAFARAHVYDPAVKVWRPRVGVADAT